MITEDYVSFEVAKLLKEKGFNEYCRTYYTKHRIGSPEIYNSPQLIDNKSLFEMGLGLSAPTLQMAMKWLRLEKGIAVTPFISSVLDNREFLWDVEITVAKTNEIYKQCWVYEIYEQVCEAAVKYCLKSLL